VGKIRLRTWRRLVLILFAAIFAAIVYRWISLERLQRFAPIEISATPTPEPTATRAPVIKGKLDTAKLYNGITLHSTVETTPGADAATERIQPESYVLDLKLLARVPSPNKTIDELAKVSPQLPTLLPGLVSMLSAEPVSPLFAQLYDTKVRMLRENLGRLDLLLSRHNFFRLPDRSTASASRNSSKGAPPPSGHGCGRRWLRFGSPACQYRCAGEFQTGHQLSLGKENGRAQPVSRGD